MATSGRALPGTSSCASVLHSFVVPAEHSSGKDAFRGTSFTSSCSDSPVPEMLTTCDRRPDTRETGANDVVLVPIDSVAPFATAWATPVPPKRMHRR